MRTKPKTERSRSSAVLIALFGLPFLLFGCFMGHKTLTLFQDWYASRNWVEANAIITSLKLDDKSDHESSSYLVVATYTYEFDGRTYHGDRVGLIPDADNIGSWQQDTHARLNKRFKRGESVTCFVDPADPGRAILDRELRFAMVGIHMLFVLTFGGAGSGLIIAAFAYGRKKRAKQALSMQHPDAPWLTDPAWTTGVIKAGTGSIAIGLWIIAIFWNGISSVVPFVVIPKVIDEGTYWALLLLIFPAIGGLILYAAIRDTLRHLKFGRSYFEMKSMPGVIGGRLRGDLIILGKTRSIGAVNVAVQCKRSVTEGHGKHRSTKTEIIWSDSTKIDSPAAFGGRVSIPVDFEIPYSCPSSTEDEVSGDISWHVKAEADIPGVDLELDFKVPVFITDASDTSIGGDEIKDLDQEESWVDPSALKANEPPDSNTIQMETDMAGNTCFRNSAMPSVGFFVLMLAMTIGFTGAIGFFVWLLMQGQWTSLIGILGFGLFDLLFCFVIVSFLGSFRATITRDALVLQRRCLLWNKSRAVPWADIRRVSHKQTASSGSVAWFTVSVHPSTDRQVTALGMIKGETTARWFKRQIEKRLPKKKDRPGASGRSGATGGLSASANPGQRPTTPSQSHVPL